jgi:hypothetical protein
VAAALGKCFSPKLPTLPGRRVVAAFAWMFCTEPAIRLYKSLGTEYLDEWRNVVTCEEALNRLAHSSRLAAHP